ncbi:outer membrane protein assembly factor BamC [Massilia glaciei]|uniref:Outer membrane protein assembly factor BamC n=2 Tax=Massilia glaciei TaxID=1524097 RepID=A0A2U2HK11_9BURK|nr:outer membrane protein assembly factor BamC [Massilia glaciei]
MLSLTGCGMLGSIMESDKVDYRGAKKARSLEVPPDLTQLEKDGRYAVPDSRGVATALGQRGAGALPVAGGPAIGPVNTAALRVERSGNHRWIVAGQSPEQLWPVLKQFWADSGFTIIEESAATGVMETDWVENRAKIPQDIVRRTIGKVFDSVYGTGERDKFRTRLERAADGGTEIYISHRGAEEVFVGQSRDTTKWTGRANDPTLEAQFMSKLVARLGNSEAKLAESVVANPTVAPAHAKLVATPAGDHVEVDEGFDRAWRRVGLALDRVGFTVEDRDRVNGVYFVRYVDPEVAAKDGFLTKLFRFGGDSEKAKEAQRYRVSVKAADGAAVSLVKVQTNDGKPETSPTGAKILKLLADDLK